MQSLEIRDEIYERFLAFKIKYNPNLSNEEFILFLMTQYENCCSTDSRNGYINGVVTEHNKLDSEILKIIPDHKQTNSIINNNIELNDNEKVSPAHQRLMTCPECKYSSGNQIEIEQHFNNCHDITGAFPCTCGQCFCNLSQFLAHYISCPIAATDLQNTGLMDVEYDEEEEDEDYEETSVNYEEKDLAEKLYEYKSPMLESREPTPIQTDDSNEQPIDFHMHSPSFSNPLNLVKNENLSIKKESMNPDFSVASIDNNNSSSADKARLPDHNTSSSATLSPGNPDQPRRSSKVYQCEHCEKNFKSKGLLDQHKHLHFPPRHECEFCGRRFRWPPQFYTHKQQCSKRKFSQNDSRDGNNFKKTSYHFSPVTGNNHNNNNNNTNNSADTRLQQQGNLFPHSPVGDQCLCGYKSSIATDMFEHKRSCIATARALILQKIIDYKTIQTPQPVNNLNGTQLSTPSLHSVMNNFISNPIDNRTINTKPSNQNSKNNELKPFECDFCESRFMTKISLKQHLDGKHSDQAKYCCEKCGKGYFWNASYNYHKKKCTFQPLTGIAATSLKQ